MVRYSWRPTELRDPLGDGLKNFDEGLGWGRDLKFQQQAPELFENGAAPLSEFGLTTPPDQLREMFRNPETRELAIAQVREAEQRRADASDPFKKLQLEKAQIDLANARRGPAGPGPTAEMRNWQMAQSDPKFAEFVGMNGMKNAPDVVKQYAYYRDQATAAGEQPISFLEFKNYAVPETPKPLTDLAKLKSDLDAGLISQQQYDAVVANELASGAPKPEQPFTTLAKLKADLDAGRITPDQYNTVVANELANGQPKPPAAPSGYRYDEAGNLSFIPGGPADPASKGNKPPTDADVRAAKLSSVIQGDKDLLLGDSGIFNALTDVPSQLANADVNGARPGYAFTSPEFQSATNALTNIAQSYLYAISGQAAPAGEVAKIVESVTPKLGESEESVKNKKKRLQSYIEAIEVSKYDAPGSGGDGGEIDSLVNKYLTP